MPSDRPNTGSLLHPCGLRRSEWRKAIEFGRHRPFQAHAAPGNGKEQARNQALCAKRASDELATQLETSEFDAFSPSRALLDARARWRSASRRARPSVHGFLRNAVSFLSRAFRILPVANVSPGRVCRVAPRIFSSRENATFVRNRARAGRTDSSDRAPRAEGGDKARRRVFRTRSVDARPGKSTDARLRQPLAFPIL